MINWIIIHHRADDGARVRLGIRREGFEVHWPREVVRRPRRDDTLRPFLPGYMFAYPTSPDASWHRLKVKVPNIVGIVGVRERGAPISPPPGFVEALIDRAGGSLAGVIPAPEDEMSSSAAWSRGQTLKVTSGPMAGLHPLFQAERGPQRIAVMLTLFGVEREVLIGRDQVEAA